MWNLAWNNHTKPDHNRKRIENHGWGSGGMHCGSSSRLGPWWELPWDFFNWGNSKQNWPATTMYGVTRKRITQRYKHTENIFRKNLQLISCLFILDFWIISQRKKFYGKRIPVSSCARKETIDINILETSRNGDRKHHAIYQNNE